jgi:hypothetical protein
VTERETGGERFAVVTLTRNTAVPFPVSLRLRLADNTTQDVRLPVQIWSTCPGGCERFEAVVAVRGAVTGARLWPSRLAPDFNAANDTWGNAPDPDGVSPATAGGLTTPIGSGAAVGGAPVLP